MKRNVIFVGLSFIAGAIFFALTFGFWQDTSENTVRLTPQVVHAQTPSLSGFNSFVPLVKKVRPAVVKVVSEAMVERGSSFFEDDLFERFFNNSPRQKEKVSGIGSGFLISADGYIITNDHVVKDAIKVIITTIDKKEYTAKIIGNDPKTDLALLKIKASNLPYIELGDSDMVEVGEWVLAIGNPFYQDLSVTAGIISAKGRQVGAAEFEDFLQTDAAINRGNSGGPLINMEGKVIGINSIIIAPTGGSVGIGFAIPSNMAKKVVDDLKKQGRVIRGYLGIMIQEVTEAEAKSLDLNTGGILIAKVEEDSPAQKAGLKRYDMITKINGKKITSMPSFRNQIANLNPGDTVELTINSDNKDKTVTLKVGEAPDSAKYQAAGPEKESVNLGMVLIENSAAVAREYELRTAKGIVVKSVDRGGAAVESGIRPGDVILEINRTPLNTVRQFIDIISKKEKGSKVLLLVNRAGEEFFIRLSLPE